MTKKTVDRLLVESTRQLLSHHRPVRRDVKRLVTEVNGVSSRRGSSRFRAFALVVPAIGLGGLALTGGALSADTTQSPAAVILVELVSARGEMTTCSLNLASGSLLASDSDTVTGAQSGEGNGELAEETRLQLPEFETSDTNMTPVILQAVGDDASAVELFGVASDDSLAVTVDDTVSPDGSWEVVEHPDVVWESGWIEVSECEGDLP